MYLANTNPSLLEKLPEDTLKNVFLGIPELKQNIFEVLQKKHNMLLGFLQDTEIIETLSEKEFQNLVSVIGAKEFVEKLVKERNLKLLEHRYVTNLIKKDSSFVLELLTNLDLMNIIPRNFAQEMLNIIDRKQLLIEVLKSEHSFELLGSLYRVDNTILQDVSVAELSKTIYNASEDTLVKYFELIPITFSHICYVKLREYLGKEWMYKIDRDLSKKMVTWLF